jgi:hypothetical protein
MSNFSKEALSIFSGLFDLRPHLWALHLSLEEAVHREDLQRPQVSAGHRHPGEVLPHRKNEAAETDKNLGVGVQVQML